MTTPDTKAAQDFPATGAQSVAMTARFTPGPWEVYDDLEHPLHLIWWREVSAEPEGPGILVARTCFAPASEANAHLIAAAPDMYEALESAAEHVCSFRCPSAWRTADGPPPHSPECQAITAALAKARGQ